MALFGKTKNEKTEDYLAARGVKGLSQDSYAQVQRIANEMAGNGVLKAGLALSFSSNGVDQAKLSYLSALVEQNWILINQNQQIIDELKKLNDK
ncbi:hypothetical protein U5M32_06065 [Streptococcus sp. TATVAM-FAB35]|uniref:hypothetical protein n=1 Tax=Streptococcus TaxID=1301 RepID=UPI003980FE62